MTDLVRHLWRRLRSEAVRRACEGQIWRLLTSSVLSSAAAVLESVSLILLTALALKAAGSESSQIGRLPGLPPQVDLSTLLAAMACVIVGRLLLQVLAAVVTARTISAVVAARRRAVISSYLRASWLSQLETEAGQLQDLTNNFAPRVGQLLGNIVQLINRGLSAIIMLVVALVVSPIAAAGVLLLSVAVFALLAPLRLKIRRFARKGSRASLDLGRRVSEVPGLAREIRTYSVAGEVRDAIDEPISTLRATQVRGEVAIGLSVPLFQAIALAGFTAFLSLATSIFGDDVAGLGAVVLVAFRSLSYGQALLASANRITDLAAWVERFDSSMARLGTSPMQFGTATLSSPLVLELDRVSFNYPQREIPALEEVSCRIEAGSAVGLVGPTGSGKSTFVALLLRLIQPTLGSYRINGVAALDYSSDTWARAVAFLPQVPEMVGGTIRDNVAFFRDVSDEAVERALEDANLWNELQSLPKGIHTAIGFAGSNLSGGQRQRLALARALVGQPRLLILDEPTSALDPLSEHAIMKALDTLRGSVTTFTVAHRLSTLKSCDQILILEAGRLVDAGPPRELAMRHNFYSRSLAAGRLAEVPVGKDQSVE